MEGKQQFIQKFQEVFPELKDNLSDFLYDQKENTCGSTNKNTSLTNFDDISSYEELYDCKISSISHELIVSRSLSKSSGSCLIDFTNPVIPNRLLKIVRFYLHYLKNKEKEDENSIQQMYSQKMLDALEILTALFHQLYEKEYSGEDLLISLPVEFVEENQLQKSRVFIEQIYEIETFEEDEESKSGKSPAKISSMKLIECLTERINYGLFVNFSSPESSKVTQLKFPKKLTEEMNFDVNDLPDENDISSSKLLVYRLQLNKIKTSLCEEEIENLLLLILQQYSVLFPQSDELEKGRNHLFLTKPLQLIVLRYDCNPKKFKFIEIDQLPYPYNETIDETPEILNQWDPNPFVDGLSFQERQKFRGKSCQIIPLGKNNQSNRALYKIEFLAFQNNYKKFCQENKEKINELEENNEETPQIQYEIFKSFYEQSWEFKENTSCILRFTQSISIPKSVKLKP